MDLLRNITLFVYTVIVNLVLRIAMYTACGVIMRGYIDRYIIDPAQRGGNPYVNEDLLCNAIYPSSLYIMQGVLEGLVCLLILFLSKSVADYVLSTH